jgi:hypothetical protein
MSESEARKMWCEWLEGLWNSDYVITWGTGSQGSAGPDKPTFPNPRPTLCFIDGKWYCGIENGTFSQKWLLDPIYKNAFRQTLETICGKTSLKLKK